MKLNSKQKITIAIGIIVIVIAFIIWLANGAYLFTQTQVLVSKKDPLFGTTYRVWQNKFIWGLDLTLIVTAASVVISGLLFFIFKEKRKAS